MKQTDTDTGTRLLSLKERQRQEREALILQVAADVLVEKGYYEASIDEIAARVGIAKGTVYLHFPSKEDLVIALLKRDIEQLAGKIDEIINANMLAQSKMEAVLQCMYGSIFAKRMQLISNVIHSMDSPRQFKEKSEQLHATWERLGVGISGVLEQGKSTGEFDADIPTPVMLNAFFSLLSPRSYVLLVVEGKMSGDELAKYLGRIYFKGIKTTLC